MGTSVWDWLAASLADVNYWRLAQSEVGDVGQASSVRRLMTAPHIAQMAWINKRPTTSITAQVTP